MQHVNQSFYPFFFFASAPPVVAAAITAPVVYIVSSVGHHLEAAPTPMVPPFSVDAPYLPSVKAIF